MSAGYLDYHKVCLGSSTEKDRYVQYLVPTIIVRCSDFLTLTIPWTYVESPDKFAIFRNLVYSSLDLLIEQPPTPKTVRKYGHLKSPVERPSSVNPRATSARQKPEHEHSNSTRLPGACQEPHTAPRHTSLAPLGSPVPAVHARSLAEPTPDRAQTPHRVVRLVPVAAAPRGAATSPAPAARMREQPSD